MCWAILSASMPAGCAYLRSFSPGQASKRPQGYFRQA
jgi:hypothetical protein